MPIRSRKEALADAGSVPRTSAVPDVRVRCPSRISTMVDLPAPLGPSRANTSPRSTSNDTPSTARTAP